MVGEQIRQARQQRGLSQEEAARLAGVARKQFWKLETDRGVTLETFRRVVTALKMPVVTLGEVEIVPGSVDPAALLEAAQTTLDALRNLVRILQPAPAQRSDPSSDLALAEAAAVQKSPITADHPTVQMLHALVDQLAAAKPARKP